MTLIDDYLDYQIKYEKEYGKKTVIFMQVGHFYECYEVDCHEKIGKAKELSDILNIVLTRKSKKNNLKEIDRKNPYLIGVQIYSFDKYLKILLKNQYTIVKIDEVTPAPNPTRKVTQIYSPGTYLENSNLNNYTLSLYVEKINNLLFFGLSVIDLTIGESVLYEVNDKPNDKNYAIDEVQRFISTFKPSEIIIHSSCFDKQFFVKEFELNYCPVHYNSLYSKKYEKLSFQETFFNKLFKNNSDLNILEFLNFEQKPFCRLSYLYLLEFCYKHDDAIIEKLSFPSLWNNQKHLILNSNTIEQLNLPELLMLLNKCQTVGGKRMFKYNLLNPIFDKNLLEKKYDLVEKIQKSSKNYNLRQIVDLERYHRKLSLQKLHPCEFYTLIVSYKNIIEVLEILKNDSNIKTIYQDELHNSLISIVNGLENDLNVDDLIKYKLNDITRNFFKKSKFNNLDDLMNKLEKNFSGINEEAKYFNDILIKEFNKNDEYIKISKTDKEGYFLVTSNRRATFLKKKKLEINYKTNTSVTKLFTKKIKELSNSVILLENEIKHEIKDVYSNYISNFYNQNNEILSKISKFISEFDVALNNAKMAKKYNYCKPIINQSDSSFVNVEQARHPIVEIINQNEVYVPNNLKLNNNLRGVLLFGVNACGKSSLIKSVGLLVVMAQAGLYVPAKKLNYYPYKILLTRIMGNDNLMKNQSSFVVEMIELRSILNRANKFSLILGDEICRGTEINSGIALVAASIIQLQKKNATFIYTTHLHDLANMDELKFNNVKCFHLKTIVDQNKISYNRILQTGSGSSIYGLEVARALDLNNDFIRIAEDIRKKRIKKHNTILPTKTSKYNNNIYIDECKNCGSTENLETHHINFQKNANQEGFIEHFHKNSKHNLMILCKTCHDKIDTNELIIENNEIIKSERKTNKKFNKNEIDFIKSLKEKNITQKNAVVFLKQKNISIGATTLRKIWNDQY